MDHNKLVLFQGNKIRRVLKDGEWWFSVIDVVNALTQSVNSRDYWYKMKVRVKEESEVELSTICRQLKLESTDGKMYETDCANTAGVLRIIQSIPSPKAEPFKRWLSQVGYERIQEIENPELAQKRMKQLYEQKGYSKNWIEKRLRGIAIRQDLTEEWRQRGINDNKDYAILTAEISKATFDVTPSQYKKIKGLKRENLRDHMTDLELIFNMLGEKVTTEISKQEKPTGINKSKEVAKRGGTVAGVARKATEKELGKPVVSKDNYLKDPQDKKLI